MTTSIPYIVKLWYSVRISRENGGENGFIRLYA